MSDKLLRLLIIGTALLFVGWGGFSWINYQLGLENDNLLEESAEFFYRVKFSEDIDFTAEDGIDPDLMPETLDIP